MPWLCLVAATAGQRHKKLPDHTMAG